MWGAIRWTKLQHWEKFGDFSYGVYIFAWPLMMFACYFGLQKPACSPTSRVIVVATHAIAFCSWHLIEKPAMSLKDWSPAPLLGAAARPGRRAPTRSAAAPEPETPEPLRPAPAADASPGSSRHRDRGRPPMTTTETPTDGRGRRRAMRAAEAQRRSWPAGCGWCHWRCCACCVAGAAVVGVGPRRPGHARRAGRGAAPAVADAPTEGKAAGRGPGREGQEGLHAEVQHRRHGRAVAGRGREGQREGLQKAIKKENPAYVKRQERLAVLHRLPGATTSPRRSAGSPRRRKQREAWAKLVHEAAEDSSRRPAARTTSWSSPANWDVYPQKLPDLGPEAARHHLAREADGRRIPSCRGSTPARRCTRRPRSTTPTSRSTATGRRTAATSPGRRSPSACAPPTRP